MLNFYIPPLERSDMQGRFVTILPIASILTVILCISNGNTLLDQGVYCFSILIFMWLFIDVGDCIIFDNAGKRFSFTRKRFVYFFIAVILATFAGFYAGDKFTGSDYLHTKSHKAWIWAFIDLGFTALAVWFFSQRHQHKQDLILTNETRLRLLESQLEPHMLFNTMANLRALVKTNPDLATQMLDSIVDYLRATLGGSRATMHPMSEEFSRLNDYLEIMKIRMGERLGYTLDLPAELASHPIPPFLLQPLVENAIKHGLEPKVEGGRIAISALIKGEKVVIDVSDTGIGSDPEQLSRANGFGIVQVTERLSAAYGSNGAINFIAAEAYKTTAKITFPYIIQHTKIK